MFQASFDLFPHPALKTTRIFDKSSSYNQQQTFLASPFPEKSSIKTTKKDSKK